MSDRRTFLMGAAALPLATIPALAITSDADARLVALAKSYDALEHEIAAHKGTEDEFNSLCGGFSDIEDEMMETEATSMTGVLAKARLCQRPVMRGCSNEEFLLSIADDLVRLFPNGSHSGGLNG